MVRPHGNLVAHCTTSFCRFGLRRFTPAARSRAAAAVRIRARKVDPVLLVNFALDPVRGFAEVVDALDRIAGESGR